MAFLKIPDKDPDECIDYVVRFDGVQAENVALASATVEIESATPDESPYALTFPYSPQAEVVDAGSPVTSPQFEDGVRIWLANGTEGTKYTLKVTATDETLVHPRVFVRRATVKVKKL